MADFRDFYRQGWAARAAKSRACPFEKMSEGYRYWWKGWFDASRDPALEAEEGTETYFYSRSMS